MALQKNATILHDAKTVQTTVIQRCMFCMKASEIKVPTNGFFKWFQGALIQDAFPNLTPGQRETLQSGSHEECFDDAFAEPIVEPE